MIAARPSHDRSGDRPSRRHARRFGLLERRLRRAALPLADVRRHSTGDWLSLTRKRDGMVYLRAHQREDGGWGFTSRAPATSSPPRSLRRAPVLGRRRRRPRLARARAFLDAHGGPLASASWGKFTLAWLGLYDWTEFGRCRLRPGCFRVVVDSPVAVLVPQPDGLSTDVVPACQARQHRSSLIASLRAELYGGPPGTRFRGAPTATPALPPIAMSPRRPRRFAAYVSAAEASCRRRCERERAPTCST
jgi:hypothetical protein